MRISKVYQLSEDQFRQIVKKSHSYAECARKIGLSVNGANATLQIKKRILELNLSTEHFNATQDAHAATRYNLADILIENSTYANITRLKERLLAANLLEYKCAICGNTGEWNGQKLILQLDHINGNHMDHRLSNLRFLCPNCHSQTTTFSGKNKN